jgi:prepilin-type N-terminal cleavage/methylation domain-containing protein
MGRRQTRRNFTQRAAFTLIELLMVITAMTIIAGVIVPQVGSAIDEAKHATMLNQLHQLQMAIERYQLEHDGKAPDQLVNRSLPQLINHTNAAGVVGTGGTFPLGPYVRNRMPVNPLNDSSEVFRSNSAPPANLAQRVGWVYHPETGQIWAGLYQGSVPTVPADGSN